MAGNTGSVIVGSCGSAGNGGGNAGSAGSVGSAGIGMLIGLIGSNGALRLTANAPATPRLAPPPPPEIASAVKSATPFPPSSAWTWICGAVTLPAMKAWLLWLVKFAAAAMPSATDESTACPVAKALASLSIVEVTETGPPEVTLAPAAMPDSAELKSRFKAPAAAAPTAPSPVPSRPVLIRSRTATGAVRCRVWRLSTSLVGSRSIALTPFSASARVAYSRNRFASTTRTK